MTGIIDQFELGWRFNPLEKRNAHGEWTRDGATASQPNSGMKWTGSGAAYKDPPADRVNMAGLKGSENPFIKKYGLSSANIVKAYDESTPDERAQGMRWYSDAHEVAQAIGKGDSAKGAAMLSAFSVQTDWATDMMNAASTLANGKVPDHGVGITGTVRARAQAILDAKTDADIARLFPKAGSAKTRNFYMLIRNGGDTPDDSEGHVVIDRHALSVAAGRRLTSQETMAPTYAQMKKDHPDWTHEQMRAYRATFPDDPTGSIYSYQHIADMYRKAALEVSRRDGVQISPHQLQAITWMHQLHSNDEDDGHLIELAAEAVRQGGKFTSVPGAATAKGRASAMARRWAAVAAYAAAHQVPVHKGTTVMAGDPLGILGQLIELGWQDELRDSRGRWTRFGKTGEAADVMMKNREGFSVSVSTGQVPVHGYMVAQTDHTHTYPASILDDHNALTRAIDDLLVKEKTAFRSGNTYLGGWVHDGKLWLEPSDNITSREQAEAEGRGRNQIAIWDVDNSQEIDTGGTGGGRIYEHANAQGDRRAGAGGLRGPARGGAAGDSRGPGVPYPAGIAGQLYDLSWKDAWRHELRDSHGRWSKTGGGAPGMLDLYHHTTPENAAEIRRTGKFTSPERDEHGRPLAFFTTDPGTGSQAGGRGSGLVHIRVPEGMARLEDEFPSGEQHYSIPASQIRREHFVTGTAAEVPVSFGVKPGGEYPDDQDYKSDLGKIAQNIRDRDLGNDDGHLLGAAIALKAGHGDVGRDQLAQAARAARRHKAPQDDIDQIHIWARAVAGAQNRAAARNGDNLGEGREHYPGEFSDSILQFWKKEPDPTAKQQLNLASAAWGIGEDPDIQGTADHLREAARLASAAGRDSDAFEYRKLAARILTAKQNESTSLTAVKGLLDRSAPAIPQLLGGGKENWNGKITLFPERHTWRGDTELAEMGWDGHMEMQQAVADEIKATLDDPEHQVQSLDAFTVPLHELIHANIPEGQTYGSHKDAYQNVAVADIEEGATELATIHHAGEFFAKLGVSDRQTALLAPGGIDNPAWTSAYDKLTNGLQGLENDLEADGRPPHLQAARHLQSLLASSGSMGMLDPDDAGDVLTEIEHLGDKAAFDKARALHVQLHQMARIPMTLHSTLGDLARQKADPVAIADENAWGHYGSQTRDFQQWVQEIAKAEGYGDLRPGTPGYKRVVALSDEVNREGSAGKVSAMARQAVRALNATGTMSADALASIQSQVERSILTEWAKTDDDRGKEAFRNAGRAARMALASMAAAQEAG